MSDDAKSWDRSRKPPQERRSVVVTTKITPVDEARLETHLGNSTRSSFANDAIRERLDRLDAG